MSDLEVDVQDLSKWVKTHESLGESRTDAEKVADERSLYHHAIDGAATHGVKLAYLVLTTSHLLCRTICCELEVQAIKSKRLSRLLMTTFECSVPPLLCTVCTS